MITLRAVILGLAGVVFLSVFTFFNNQVLRQTHLVGNFMPIAIYGGLLVFLLTLNSLLARWGERWAFGGKELVIIIAMMLAAATVPGSGLMRSLPSLLMLPHHIEKSEPGWRATGVVAMMPEGLLAERGAGDEALNSFVQGMKRGDHNVRLADVPWGAWTRALAFWIPLVASIYTAMLGLALVYHWQWAHHEQLPYPIVKFTNAMLPDRPGAAYGAVLQNRLFWLGTIFVSAIHVSRYIYVWCPSWIDIPLNFDFTKLFRDAPSIRSEGLWAWEFRIYFSVIAIAYFLAADVGLAIGLAPIVYPFIAAFFSAQGLSLKGGGFQSPERFVVAGAFFGTFATFMYTGRHYYLTTLCQALGILKEGSTAESVWGARVFLLGIVFFIGMLMTVGMSPALSAILAFLLVVFYSVLGRVLAETGLFFMQAMWLPGALFVGLLGVNALGPEMVVLLFFVSVLLAVDPREAIMPFLVNALKLVEVRQVSLGKSSGLFGLALVVALAVAVPVTIYLHYNYGAPMHDGWTTGSVPRVSFDETVKVAQGMIAPGTESGASAGRKTLGMIMPDRTLLGAFTAGMALTLAFSLLRLRVARWPIHPVCFLVFCTYSGYMFAFSFLAGWAFKVLVTKYGGEHGYNGLKPLMFGLIAGDLLSGLVPMVTGWMYHAATGDLPRGFSIFPE